MSKLEQLREKYKFGPSGKYEPKQDCKFCNGAGEHKLKNSDYETFCVCLYIPPELSGFVGDTLKLTVENIKLKMVKHEATDSQ